MTTSRTIASLFAATALACSAGAYAWTSQKSNLGSCNVNGKTVSSSKEHCATSGGKWHVVRHHQAGDTGDAARSESSMVGKTAAGGAPTPSAAPGPQGTTTRESGD